jgi:ACS family hexuronate transporter-like MFS transporter
LAALSLLRFTLGLGEAGNWPGAAKVVAEWFPVRERALALGVFNSGAVLGSVVATPLIIWLQLHYGWQATFLITGGLGFLWLLLWLAVYRPPQQHPWLGEQERAHILDGRPAVGSTMDSTGISWLRLLRYRQVWAIVIARLLVDPVWWLYIFWLPEYLHRARGFSLQQIGLFAWAPYAAADAGSLLGGYLSGWLIQRGWSVDRARKTLLVASAVMMPAGILAARVESPMVALALIGLVLFGFQAWINNLQTLPSDLFPSAAVGSVAGMGGAGAGIGSMFFILGTGWMVDHFSYTPVLTAAGVLGPLGCLVLLSLVGKIERIEWSEAS